MARASFPFDGTRGLVSDIVYDSIDRPFHRIRDAGTDCLQNFVRDFRVASRHTIHRLYGTNNDRFAIGSHVTVNSDTANR